MSGPIPFYSTHRPVSYIFGDRLQLMEQPLRSLFTFLQKIQIDDKYAVLDAIDGPFLLPLLHDVFDSYSIPYGFISRAKTVKIPYDLFPTVSLLDQMPAILHAVERKPQTKREQFELLDEKEALVEYLQILYKQRKWLLSFIQSLQDDENNGNNATIATKSTRGMSESSSGSNTSSLSNLETNLPFGPIEGGRRRRVIQKKLKSRRRLVGQLRCTRRRS